MVPQPAFSLAFLVILLTTHQQVLATLPGLVVPGGGGSLAAMKLKEEIKTRVAGLPAPPLPVSPLDDLNPSLLNAGDFADLSSFGGPRIGIQKALLQALQNNLVDGLKALNSPVFDLFFNFVADKWTKTLVNFAYTPGLMVSISCVLRDDQGTALITCVASRAFLITLCPGR
jgi:hypothetical protein